MEVKITIICDDSTGQDLHPVSMHEIECPVRCEGDSEGVCPAQAAQGPESGQM